MLVKLRIMLLPLYDDNGMRKSHKQKLITKENIVTHAQ